MRLFIAVNPPEDIKSYVVSFQKLFAGMGKFSFAQECHLTLKFLGEVSPSNAEKVKEMLDAVKASVFSLELDGLGVFPSEAYCRVVWAGVSPAEPVVVLAQQINEELHPFFQKDKRFHPHFTIARIKMLKDKELFLKTVRETRIEPKRFSVKSFELIQSTLQAGKPPVYTTLKTYELRKVSGK